MGDAVILKDHDVAWCGQIAQVDDLVDTGAGFEVFHGFDAPMEVFDDIGHNGVSGVVDSVGHHGELFVDSTGEDDGVEGLCFRLDVADFVIEGGEIGVLSHDVDGMEVVFSEFAVFEVDRRDGVVDEGLDVVLHQVVGLVGL